MIAYEELLPFATSGVQYRFPPPDCKLAELQFSLNADAAESRGAAIVPADVSKLESGGRATYSRTWKEKGPGGDFVFAYVPAKRDSQVISGRQGESGPLYFYT